MQIGVSSSHLYSPSGGGFSAVYWHVHGLQQLGHTVDVYHMYKPHPMVLNNWRSIFGNATLARYQAGVEKNYEVFIGVDHFQHIQPLAQLSMQHVFFPHIDEAPAKETRLYANSKYTADHIRHKWNRDCEVMYIPIKGIYNPLRKEQLILHVSRITEPSAWADKAHRQMISVFKMYQRELPGWQLVIAGALDPQQEDYFNELTLWCAGANISFLMNPSDQELADLYGKASFYWHATGVSLPHIPSAQEHLGLAPLEASAAGAVPVVFNSGGMPEVVINGQTGVLFDDPRQMGQFTVKMTQNWSIWSTLMQQGLRWSRKWQDFPAFKMRLIKMLAGLPIEPELPDYEIEVPPIANVTAVIPTWNNNEMLHKCLESIVGTAPQLKVLIINNGETLPDWNFGENVMVYNAGENLGFAGAHRKAEELVDTPLVLMLNDDVEATSEGWLQQMLYEFRDKDVAAVTAKLLFPNGTLQHAGGMIDWNRNDIGYHRFYMEQDGPWASQVEEVAFGTGACLLLERKFYHMPQELIGGLYFEDTWICGIIREAKKKIIYQPGACLIHYEGVTRTRSEQSLELIERNKRVFTERWS